MSYYEILTEYWRTGKIEDAIKYFRQWKEEGLLSGEEIEKLNNLIPDELDYRFEIFTERLDSDPKLVFDLYTTVKNKRKWDDNRLCENLGISKEDINKIISLEGTSKRVRYKILNELLNSIINKNNAQTQ